MIYAVAVKDTLADENDLPRPDAVAYLQLLKEAGHTVIIHDSLANTAFGLKKLTKWLNLAGIDAYDDIWVSDGKPEADVYVDNRSEKWPGI